MVRYGGLGVVSASSAHHKRSELATRLYSDIRRVDRFCLFKIASGHYAHCNFLVARCSLLDDLLEEPRVTVADVQNLMKEAAILAAPRSP